MLCCADAVLCYAPTVSVTSPVLNPAVARHSALVRVTHWLTVLSFFALLLSGAEITISHPRFYWGETGNSGMAPLFIIPIPASRGTVPTGYGYTMPDANGWSRYLHFEAAWVVVLTGFVYVLVSLWNGHLRRDLVPAAEDRIWRAPGKVFSRYLRRSPPVDDETQVYNVVQRLSYLAVIFVLFPLVIWTGLALSPSFDAAFPGGVNVLGGRQSARTLHFIVTLFLVLFLVVHVAMIALAGFWSRTRAMITGRVQSYGERP